MKKIYLLIAIFFALIPRLRAQGNQPQAFELKTDTATSLELSDKYWQFVEDPAGKLNINQVSSPAFDSKFHRNTTLTKGYDYHVTHYWLRYKIKNTFAWPVTITIPEKVAYAWLYIPAANGKWVIEKNGVMVPWSERSGLKRIAQFEATLQPGQEILFYENDIFLFNFYRPPAFHFTIGFAKPVIDKNYLNDDDYYYQNLLSALITGVMLLAALLNIFFYKAVRERLYLYFSLFLILTALYYVAWYTKIEFVRQHPYADRVLIELFLVGYFFCFMHFVRHFLSTREKTPGWDKFLRVLSFMPIPIFLRAWYLPSTMPYHTALLVYLPLNVVEYCYMPVIFGTLLYYIQKNKGSDRAGIYAMLPVFVWFSTAYTYIWANSELFDFFHVPHTKIYVWIQAHRFLIEFFCFSWLAMVFSWLLVKRFQLVQQGLAGAELEKERLEKEREIERSQLIEKQNAELEVQVASRTAELKRSLEELKNTQTQLIQSEKMASLGELTAGIAHEIQNPLNFVNNFSEVNTELIDEMEEEIAKGRLDEVKAIAADIKDNQLKINQHGKRADFIVKGMLQHSRKSSGEKQPTNMNVLCDEFLKLSFHGLRARDKSFNAEMVTHFDPNLPAINVSQQDIGRVMLNLFNNAFYAVNQKSKTAGANYKPTVEISTAQQNSSVIISVKDNGNGIPEAIKDKIMQPFFTTKPTGEGTGLGLSLSYDIVVKGHGGTIDVKSEDGKGSEFRTSLPLI